MKNSPKQIFYKNDYSNNEYESFNIKKKKGARFELKSKFIKKLDISEPKLKDLLKLCDSGVIPEAYHSFYKSLNQSSLDVDYLDETDIEDDDSES